MQAKAERVGEILHIKLVGKVDYESVDAFSEMCLKNLLHERVVFNFIDLQFVGSTGITSLVDAIVRLSMQSRLGVKLCHLGIEFRRVFESSDINKMNLFENLDMAHFSFYSQVYAPVQPTGYGQPQQVTYASEAPVQQMAPTIDPVEEVPPAINIDFDPLGADSE